MAACATVFESFVDGVHLQATAAAVSVFAAREVAARCLSPAPPHTERSQPAYDGLSFRSAVSRLPC